MLHGASRLFSRIRKRTACQVGCDTLAGSRHSLTFASEKYDQVICGSACHRIERSKQTLGRVVSGKVETAEYLSSHPPVAARLLSRLFTWASVLSRSATWDLVKLWASESRGPNIQGKAPSAIRIHTVFIASPLLVTARLRGIGRQQGYPCAIPVNAVSVVRLL